jgi:HPt (histidine-containing phosphotransfer) domain-containing protein
MSLPNDPAELLYSTLADDPDLAEIVELFVQEMPERIARLLDRFRKSDREGLRRVAHQLKGAAGSYGFTPVSPAAARLEGAIVQSRPEEEISQALDDLIDLCRRTRAGTPWSEIGIPNHEIRNPKQIGMSKSE